METTPEQERLAKILQENPRYSKEGYYFVNQAFCSSIGINKALNRKKSDGVICPLINEIFNGIRDTAIEQFGPLAYMVFSHWGIRGLGDFGVILSQLVNSNLIKIIKSASNIGEEFSKKYGERSLEEAFNVVPVIEYNHEQGELGVSYRASKIL